MIDKKELYRSYSEYLVKRYGEKVYKIPISIPVTCPNRDGKISTGGCIYCGSEGVGYENLSTSIKPIDQFITNSNYIKKKYKAYKYIPYFQNYTNTYLSYEEFKNYIEQICVENVVAISISTRPDCISNKQLEFLKEIKNKYNIDIIIELGLQTTNYHTLIKINRGHTLAEFIDASLRIKSYGLQICSHAILNLPWDNMVDSIECAKIISALNIDFVKLHGLYIEKNTKLAELYEKNEIKIISVDEYVNRTIEFLEHLSPEIIIQRLIGRAPEENTIFMNWNMSWWKIKDMIEEKMIMKNTKQGKKYNYLNGSALF